MSLTRHWYPSPNYSGGSKKRLIVIHTTEGFTGNNGMYDCAIYFQGPVGASSHVVIDNYHPGHICEGVNRANGSWTQCNYNSVSVSVEQCAYASWSRNTWLNDKSDLLKNTAQWIAEEASKLGIPITRLSASQAQGGSAGICGHSDLGSAGCGHSDPGSGYPWDVVLDWARNGISQPVPPKPVQEEEEEMPSCSIPPKAISTLPISLSLPGAHKAMGVCVDVGVLDDPHTQIRAAFHSTDNSGWEVIQVYADPSHTKVVVWPKKPFDGVSLSRIDDQDVIIVADFGK
jgi:hypothetical protein